MIRHHPCLFFFFFNDTATTEIYTLSLHDALPISIVSILRTQRVGETLRNVGVLVRGFFSFGLRANPKILLDNPALLKVPFGVAVAVSTVLCFCAARWAPGTAGGRRFRVTRNPGGI